MEEVEKFDEFIIEVDVEHLGCKNHLQDFELMKNIIEIAMDVWWNNWRKECGYKKKDS